MKLTDEAKERLENIKKQISMEKEYINNNFEYPLLLDSKSNNFGFINIIPISIILVIVAIILIIIL